MAWGLMAEEIFGLAIIWSSGMQKSHPGFGFCIINMSLFLFVLYEYYTGLYVDHMAMFSLVFLFLLCWLYICFMTEAMYGSNHVFTGK